MHSSTSSTVGRALSTTPVPPLVRPWSAPLPVSRGSRVRGRVGKGALAAGAFLLGASASWAATADASPAVLPTTVPVAVADPFCQWSAEPHRTVTVFGNDVQAWRVRVRGLGTVSVDVPNRSGRSWVGIGLPRGTAEDDIRKVECKVGGQWRVAEPS
jgi:hypothetical protein